MRIPTALLTLSASAAIGLVGALGTAAPVGAEPIAMLNSEYTPSIAAATGNEPEDLDDPEPKVSDFEVRKNDAEYRKPAPLLLAWDRQAKPLRRKALEGSSLQPDAPGNDKSPLAAATPAIDEDWPWEQEFRDSVRPFYDHLVDSGMVDAVNGLKSYLSLVARASFDALAKTDYAKSSNYGAGRDAALWEMPDNRFDANIPQRSAADIERDRVLASILVDELIETVKPWFYGLAALFLLWHAVQLMASYSRWKSTRPLKRGAKSTRNRRPARLR